MKQLVDEKGVNEMWIFEQSTGKLYRPDGSLAATGYAGGNCGKNPEGVNNPSLQSVPTIGPLPVNDYTPGTPVPQSHLGPFAIPLIPTGTGDMFGRGHFYMHGDTTPSGNASEGCIIMPRAVRNEFYNSVDNKLSVVREI
jgi:hypothetical protein